MRLDVWIGGRRRCVVWRGDSSWRRIRLEPRFERRRRFAVGRKLDLNLAQEAVYLGEMGLQRARSFARHGQRRRLTTRTAAERELPATRHRPLGQWQEGWPIADRTWHSPPGGRRVAG